MQSKDLLNFDTHAKKPPMCYTLAKKVREKNMLKRIFLFLAVNFAIVMTISLLMQILGVKPYITQYGLDIRSLAIFCFIWGMAGALISLLISRKLAKWMFSIDIIDPRQNTDPRAIKLYETVVTLSQRIGLPEIPQVGIFNSPQPNAFATGPSKRSSLVAVSTGLLDNLAASELEAVIGHELAHISNGDMVTLTLLQGIVNAFVMFLARICAFFISGLGRSRDSRSSGSPMSYYLMTFLFEIIFMIIGSMIVASFSRYREFRADKGSAKILGAKPMISALSKLKAIHEGTSFAEDRRLKNVEALMITRPNRSIKRRFELFASHPPIDKRIEALLQIEQTTPIPH